QELEQRLAHEARAPFELGQAPLLRILLVRLAPERHVLARTMHQLASDHASLRVFAAELAAGYSALRRGDEPDLPDLPRSVSDHAAAQRQWLEGPDAERQLEYWVEELAGLQPLELPTDRPRPPVQSFHGRRARLELPASLVERLEKTEGADLHSVLLAAFGALLARLAGLDEVAIGSRNQNRA